MKLFLQNIVISDFIKIHSVGAELFHADRQTHDAASSHFLQFCEHAEKCWQAGQVLWRVFTSRANIYCVCHSDPFMQKV